MTSGTIESHLQNMQRNARWGTQVEIRAAASLFQVPIYVATSSLIQGVYKQFEGAKSAEEFLANHSRCIKRVLPDGNCLFRALSQQLSGIEELHQTWRELLVIIFCNVDSFHCRVTSGTIESHLQNMQINARWGTQVKIRAAASPNLERATGKVYFLQLQSDIWNNRVPSSEHAEKCSVGYTS